MLRYTIVTAVAGLTHTHSAFLAAAPEEKMGPNMAFSPLSTTMTCVINLTILYMAIFCSLGICRSVLDFQRIPHEKHGVQRTLKHASETVFYAPMACLMFLGCRMRVLQLTKGEGDPQDWVRFSMYASTYAITTNTLLTLLIPVFSNVEVELDKKTGEIKADGKNPFTHPVVATVFTCLKYVTFLALYIGFGAVCVGVIIFEPDAGTWAGDVPPVSPAVACTMLLATTFFIIFFLAAAARTYSIFVGGNTFTSDFEKVMMRASDTMSLAPMFCTLFLACRMRALQMDPITGNPQTWAQSCFYAVSYALIAQAVLAVVIPLAIKGAKVEDSRVEGDVTYRLDNSSWYMGATLSALRWIIMISIYVGGLAVVCSAFTIEHPDGKEHTPPLSPTVLCVINLTFQYFFIYLLLWIFITVEDLTSFRMDAAKDAIESAKATVQFAPMMGVLFIGTRMRALQLSDNKGAPQGWVQDGMYLATWSIMIQFVMCLVMPFITGKTYHPDTLAGEHGAAAGQVDIPKSPQKKGKKGEKGEKGEEAEKAPVAPVDDIGLTNPAAWWIVTIIRYVALVALLGGIATVITGAVVMTPETANGSGNLPVIADGTLPIDLAPKPMTVADLPGVEKAMETTGEAVGNGAAGIAGAPGTLATAAS